MAERLMKPKILFIMHMPPPIHGAAMMGQYVHDSKLINEEFDCVYINPSASKNVADIGNISFRKFTFLFSNLFTIIKTVKREKPDLCYLTPSSWDFGFYRDWLTTMIIKAMEYKVIVHFHNKGVKSFEEKWYNKLLYKSFFRNIKTIFLADNLVYEFKKYLDPSSIFICPNGIKETVGSPYCRNEYHSPYTFLFLSNMIESKGVYILLEACSILKQKGYLFKCDFIGRWSDITEESFLQKVSLLNLTDAEVKAHGAKYNNEKNSYFENSDALIFPTYYSGETFGLVLLEAMEYALPCISTYEGGVPSVIDNYQTGLLVHQNNPEELAEKMIWLIEHPEKGLEMGKNGNKKFLNEYTVSTFENNLYNILKNSLIL